MNRLDGKVAIVTGGVSGFGLASAKLFAQEGAKVTITDVNDSKAEAALEEIGKDNAILFNKMFLKNPIGTQFSKRQLMHLDQSLYC